MIVALAGRRIDLPDTHNPRFPLQNTTKVRRLISDILMKYKATTLVCSGSCGADLLALDVAGELGLRRRIVLPFECDRFRKTSVIDRPGDWSSLFDRVCKEVEAIGDLIILHEINKESPFITVNHVILDEAWALAFQSADRQKEVGNNLGDKILAVLVWDGISRGKGDVTDAFMNEAHKRGFPIVELSTK